MFNFSFNTYILISILLLVVVFLYTTYGEHFSPKNKKKFHMVKVKKQHKIPGKGPVTMPITKPVVNYQTQINSNLDKDRETHYHNHHYYDYSDYNYPNFWYEYLYPRYWVGSWWGYPSVYDPKLSVPYVNDEPPVNIGDNCHKKCLDRYENEVDTDEYTEKVENCIDKYCY